MLPEGFVVVPSEISVEIGSPETVVSSGVFVTSGAFVSSGKVVSSGEEVSAVETEGSPFEEAGEESGFKIIATAAVAAAITATQIIVATIIIFFVELCKYTTSYQNIVPHNYT